MDSSVLTVADLGDDVGDIYAWVDAQCSGRDAKAHLESLLPQFHVLSQELSGNLQSCLESFPSFVTHLQLLQLKTTTLGKSLQSNGSSAPKRGASSSPQYDMLAQLHNAKTHMQQCSNALQESAAWKQHSRYVVQATTTIDTTHDLAKLATHLAAMRKSLDTLQSMPGHDERQATMETVSRDVEAALVPQLYALLQEPQLPLSHLQDCMAILGHLGRSAIIEDAYAKRRPAPMHRLWHASAPSDANGVAAFYAEVEAFIAREVRYCQQLFATPLAVVLQLLDATLTPLAGALSALLEAAPGMLLDTFRSAVAFAHQVLVQSVVSWAELSPEDLHSYLQTVFGPYKGVFVEYARLEAAVVTDALAAFVPRGPTLHAPALEELSGRVWPFLEARVQCAAELMAGAVLPDAFDALTSGLTTLATRWGDLMVAPQASKAVVDWAHLHEALAMLKACGGVLVAYRDCQARLRLRVQPTLAAWCPDTTASRVAPRIQLSPTHKGGTNPSLSVTLDDCLSPAKLPMAVAKLWLQSHPSRFHQLQLCNDAVAADDADGIFGPVFEQWTRRVQERTYATVLTPIASVLAPVPAMTSWIEVDADSDLPTFSTLPQALADLLLSLLPQLEPFAESSGLAQALTASQNVDELVHEAWAGVARVFNMPVDDAFVQLGELPGADPDASPAADFVDRWTFVVASGTMAAVLQALAAIPRLSAKGQRQVQGDVAYLQNVLNALGVPAHPLLVTYADRLAGGEGSATVPRSMADKMDLWITRQQATEG
ncbi:hypothetical protein ACHHYP_17213 [Achlya hypogyna]|uniref:Conserved oligomeric Golgi complex subunit 7 n=1 Tax=Achlya hypogyna TaxID=1202772 RepID=A0A1V9Y4X8_ACHHY|nr:hypothetical protein ACHHYP_17213 [Achlya hypogyna]